MFFDPFIFAKFQGREAGQHEALASYLGYPSPVPLSRLQEGVRFLVQTSQPASGQSLIRVIRLQGNLRLPLLKAAYQELFKRHDSLRFQVVETEQAALQIARTNWLPDLPLVDLAHLGSDSREAEAQRVLREETDRVLDLAHDPLVRSRILRFDDQTHVLLLCGHRLMIDHESLDQLLGELFIHYATLSVGSGSSLTLPTPANASPGASKSAMASLSAKVERDRQYWKRKLEGVPIVLEMPSDFPRSLTKTVSNDSTSHEVPAHVLGQLQAFCQRAGALFEAALLAAFLVLISRHTGRTDLVIGTRTMGRGRAVDRTIGCFANKLPIRGDLSGDPSFLEFLKQVSQSLHEALEHKDLPFGELVADIVSEPTRGHAPLVQFLFTVRAATAPVSTAGGLALQSLVWPAENSGLDLEVWAEVSSEHLTLIADYRTDLFERETISGLLLRYATLLEGLVASPEMPISRQALLTHSERQRTLVDWNQTQVPYPCHRTYSDCFHRRADIDPNALAVSAAGRGLTYRELNHAANRLAHYLQSIGVGNETLVGVCLDRSLDLAVALLAILKAGAAFMPLDPDYPRQRLALMIEDARPLLILTQRQHAAELPNGLIPVLCLDTESVRSAIAEFPPDLAPTSSATTDSLAYVIYTSGSTGKPNGVEITQRAMVNHSHAVAGLYKLSPSDRVLQFASLSFDIAVEEIFPSWLQGSAVIFRDEAAISSTQSFFEFLSAERITIINIPTAFWHQIVDDLGTLPFPTGVSRVIIGGEQASLAKWKLWQSRLDRPVAFFNAYGPTEAAVTSTVLAAHETEDSSVLTIGKPIANTRVYVLDQHQTPVGVGVPGELYIAGDCLARGYRGDPKLTAQRFIPDPFQATPAARMYRTGDLVRWTRQGTLEFLGRVDCQLKIRGYRIEPGEVEAALGKHPDLQACVVVGEDRSDGGKELIAYLVLRSTASVSVGELRQWLGERLADYLIPSRFIVIPSLPLTPAGKVDRRSLSRADGIDLSAGTAHADPTNPLERELVDLWRRVLRKDRIGIDDHFFDSGGNSLLAAQMFAVLETTWGKRLPLAMLFEAPTIRAMALKIQDRDWRPSWGCLVPLQTQGKGRPVFLIHGIKGNIIGFQSLARELGVDRPVYGLQAQGLDGVQPVICNMEEMARLYVKQIIATVPEGPYHLVGLSFGGLLAYEMAQQLKAMGHSVGLLGVLDAFPHGHDQQLGLWERVVYGWELNAARLRAQISIFAQEGIKGTLEVIGSKMRIFRRWVRRTFQGVSPKMPASATKSFGGSDSVEQANHLACDHYSIRPYPGKVTLFVAAENPPSIKQLLRSVWKPLPVEGVEVHESPGNHNTIVEPPHDRALALKLRSCLQAFEQP